MLNIAYWRWIKRVELEIMIPNSLSIKVVQAVSELDLNVPVIVRLEGTNAIIAKDILDKSGLSIISATTMEDAAQKCVEVL